MRLINYSAIQMLYVTFLSNVIPMSESLETLKAEHLHTLKTRSIVSSTNANFHLINITFPCSSNQTAARHNGDYEMVTIRATPENNLTQDIQVKRAWQLEDKYMDMMLRLKGGTLIKEYLATSPQKAYSDFPDAKRMRYRRSYMGRIPNNSGKDNLVDRGSYKSNPTASSDHINRILSNPTHQQYKEFWAKLTGHNRYRRQLSSTNAGDEGISGDITNQICSNAGTESEIDASYLHLCSLCSAVRNLPSDRYPNYINEVYCRTNNANCLGGSGKCVDTIFSVHILRRKDGQCILCSRDNEALAISEYELYLEPIRVGCECLLDRNSEYRSHWFSSSSTSNSDDSSSGGSDSDNNTSNKSTTSNNPFEGLDQIG